MDIPRYNNNNLHDFLLANKYQAQDYGKRCRTICHQILSNLSVLSIYIHLKKISSQIQFLVDEILLWARPVTNRVFGVRVVLEDKGSDNPLTLCEQRLPQARDCVCTTAHQQRAGNDEERGHEAQCGVQHELRGEHKQCRPRGGPCKVVALRAVLSVREWRRGAGLAAWVSSSRAVCGASVARRKACKTRWEGGPS
ncbi:hypothetical protein C8J57DRAFT_1256995 [Mycena rebaudengoi]|nr:hypothetical protein C8J57DRAFT_1256995 [Mycena rebaudengoi]